MSRHEDEYEEEPAPRSTTSGGSSVVLVAVIVAVLLVVCGGGAVVGLGLFWMGAAPAPMPPNVPAVESGPVHEDSKTTYSRKEFVKLIFGKSPAEVIELLGTPEQTENIPPDEKWIYSGRTYDKHVDQVDGNVYLWFKDGKVAVIDY